MKQIALIIEDLPFYYDTLNLPQVTKLNESLLDALREQNVSVTAFPVTDKLSIFNEVEERTAILKRWVEMGHTLGNHSDTHFHFSEKEKTVEDFYQDFLTAHHTLLKIIDKEDKNWQPRAFLYPFLDKGDAEKKEAFENHLKEHGYQIADVTLLTADWVFAKWYHQAKLKNNQEDMDYLVNEYKNYILQQIQFYEKANAILFSEDIPHVMILQANLLNADCLGQILAAIKNQGYEFISLSKALAHDVYKREINHVLPDRPQTRIPQLDVENKVKWQERPQITSLLQNIVIMFDKEFAQHKLAGLSVSDEEKKRFIDLCLSRFGELFMQNPLPIIEMDGQYKNLNAFNLIDNLVSAMQQKKRKREVSDVLMHKEAIRFMGGAVLPKRIRAAEPSITSAGESSDPKRKRTML